MPKERTILFLVYRNEQKGLQPLPVQESKSLREVLAYKFSLDDAIARALASEKLSRGMQSEPDNFDLYAWDLRPLSHNLQVREIPKPGVLFVIERTEHTTDPKKTQGQGTEFCAYLLKCDANTSEDTNLRKAVDKFLQSSDAQYEPTRFDVFLSYASKDAALASEIRNLLHQHGINCFMAQKDIHIGRFWEKEILESLRSAKIAVILLTPNSKDSKWVMCEAGAFWALEKPIVPALLFVEPESLPEPISKCQGKKIETTEGREAFYQEVARLCM